MNMSAAASYDIAKIRADFPILAREVYGKDDPQWRRFRGWMLTGASDRLLAWYLATGERAARTVRGNQHLRAQLRTSMDARLATLAT